MRRGTLQTQVLVVNLLLIAVAVLAASIASNPDSELRDSGTVGLVLGFAVSATVAVNVFLLSRRFEPLELLAKRMEEADLNERVELEPISGPEEVRRLDHSFHAMLDRLEAERRHSAGAALEAQERERSRVALELHDEVNQALTALVLRIEAIRTKAPPELTDDLAETRAVASQAMEELLSLARQLRPTALDDLGIKAALAGLVEEIDRQSEITAQFEPEGALESLSDEVALVTYRIAQESLSNAVRHAGARHIRVRVIREGPALELRVSDDGKGFDADEVERGLGLEGMRERARLVGGRLELESQDGLGTRVRLWIADAGADEKMDEA